MLYLLFSSLSLEISARNIQQKDLAILKGLRCCLSSFRDILLHGIDRIRKLALRLVNKLLACLSNLIKILADLYFLFNPGRCLFSKFIANLPDNLISHSLAVIISRRLFPVIRIDIIDCAAIQIITTNRDITKNFWRCATLVAQRTKGSFPWIHD